MSRTETELSAWIFTFTAVAWPFMALFEWFGPLVELAGYAFMLVGFCLSVMWSIIFSLAHLQATEAKADLESRLARLDPSQAAARWLSCATRPSLCNSTRAMLDWSNTA